jgi:hypothetical protein
METFMAGAAVVEIFLMSVILAVLLTIWGLRGMFWLMQGASAVRPVVARSGAVVRNLVMARVRAGHGQMSLRTR